MNLFNKGTPHQRNQQHLHRKKIKLHRRMAVAIILQIKMNKKSKAGITRQRAVRSKEKDSRAFGDKLSSKSNEIIRVMFQNIRGFGYKKDQP